MGVKRMNFEGRAYVGTAGTTASGEVTNSRDITLPMGQEYGDTTVRGSSGPPKKTSRVTQVSCDGIEVTMLNEEGDSIKAALLGAAAAGTPVALRLKDHAAGKGFDGDCNVSASQPWPLNGEQVITFSFMPTDESGRMWQGYV